MNGNHAFQDGPQDAMAKRGPPSFYPHWRAAASVCFLDLNRGHIAIAPNGHFLVFVAVLVHIHPGRRPRSQRHGAMLRHQVVRRVAMRSLVSFAFTLAPGIFTEQQKIAPPIATWLLRSSH
jgi:hypothetical protein